jgi:DNA-binding SARP family transcriptional activator
MLPPVAPAVTTPTAVQVGVLGALTLRVDGLDRPFPSGRPGRALGSLLLARGRVVSDSRLSDDVWGEEQPDDPRAALHTTVARVRRSLGTAGSLVVRHGHGYSLDRHSADLAVAARKFRLGWPQCVG